MRTSSEQSAKLNTFVNWVRDYVRGDEKGEAQIFLDRLFQAFGWEGLAEAGARCEERVKNNDGGTSFADLMWKPVVLIEMKRRGTPLGRHYSQLFQYWTRTVPNRPRYAALCNFDQIWIYDFDTQLDIPVDVVDVQDLPLRYGPLNFLSKKDEQPIFGNHQVAVTRNAADKLATCFNSLTARGADRSLAQRFILQMLMALFSEDIGLLDKYFVTRLLEECTTPATSYDLLGSLFEAMNTRGGVTGGRFQGVSYFNGGLFAVPAKIELQPGEVRLLREAAAYDWSKVRPEIFGTLFEHSLGKEARHATGAHFTSPVDIMKVVGPTIVDPWTEALESATTLASLRQLLARLGTFTVLDPACGSGNFLYLAFRELKRVEAKIYERMAQEYSSVDARQRPFGVVTASNFFGIDVNPFAIEIAKVTMSLARKLSIDELHFNEVPLPLDNLDPNFRAADALIAPDGTRAEWFKCDVIIGNPPFLDARKLTLEHGPGYAATLQRVYPEVPRRADFCTYWFRRAHDELRPCTTDDLLAGRAGLVGTQNVRNNYSRVGGLDHVVESGTVIDAVDNQPWAGEANVHVSIVNWLKSKDPKVVPAEKHLWYRVPRPPLARKRRPRGTGSTEKSFQLDMRPVAYLSSALTDDVDVSQAAVLRCNRTPQRCFEGVQPGHDGFRISASELGTLVPEEELGVVVFPYLAGTEFLTSDLRGVSEYVIDFSTMDLLEATKHKEALAVVQTRVLPDWQSDANREFERTGKRTGEHQNRMRHWWRLKRRRSALLRSVRPFSRFIVCSRVTKRPVFAFVSSQYVPDSSLSCFAFEDDYSFGILQSAAHASWFHAKCSNLKSDPRYTSESIFDTFPWPQAPTDSEIRSVAAAARQLRSVRERGLSGRKGGLRTLYRTTELPGENPLKTAQAALDAAVLEAYGFKSDANGLAQLLELNGEVTAQLAKGGTAVGPGVPPWFPRPEELVSSDYLGSTAGLL